MSGETSVSNTKPCEDRKKSHQAITCDSRFHDIQAALNEAGLAKIHSRGLGCPDPFARTIVHGYKGIAFEVMRNGYLASVTLFKC